MADPTNHEGRDAAEVVPDDDAGHRDLLATLTAGTIVEGKHRIDRIIGRGGMGVVASAVHIHLEERVALKFLEVKDEEVGHDFRARFALEARVCAKLRNEHIARVHDVGIWEGKVPFMVMEYLEGTDLRRSLRDGAKLSLSQAVEYVVQICDGLAEAHAHGIVHRDLKPANIFITRRQDGTELVKVLDFGISKWTTKEEDVGELTKTGMMLGSPKYMSPEQLNGGAIDARADVWSIGAILYQALTGRPPYDFPQVTQTFMAIAGGSPPPRPTLLEPSIPQGVEALILRCLTRDKEQRVQNVAELAGALLEAVESPFAAQVRAQIGAVLEPAAAAAAQSNRSGPLSMTTGSHAVFSLVSTGASQISVPPEARVPSARPSVAAKSRMGKTWAAAGVAVAVIGFVAFARAPRASETAQAASAPVAIGAANIAPPQTQVAMNAAATAPAVAAPSAPAPAVATQPSPAHVAPSAPHVATYAAASRTAKRVTTSSAPPPATSGAPAPPPVHTAPAPAPTHGKVDPLDDRQ